MCNKLMAAVILSVSSMALIHAAETEKTAPKQSFELTETQRVPFTGGVIRVQDSYGRLAVEGWDEPVVEITVIKSTDGFYKPEQKEQAEQRLQQMSIRMERPSDRELVISTLPPLPARLLFIPRPLQPNARRGMSPDYRIHVPRDAQVVIHHDYGYVCVSDMTGDIEVRSHTGDMIVVLPEHGSYSIDARTGLGSVSSDLVGKGRLYLAGTHFAYRAPASSKRVFLRMGRGCITVKSDSRPRSSQTD